MNVHGLVYSHSTGGLQRIGQSARSVHTIFIWSDCHWSNRNKL